MSRLIVVANRLPVSVKMGEHGIELAPTAGGLATGLRRPHERSEGLWVGWPGESLTDDDPRRGELEELLAKQRLVAVHFTADELTRYYERYCNGVLWPLFHYQLNQLPLEITDFDAYEQANQRFADAIVEQYRPGDRIWVHDYQLFLVPELVRRRLPEARIGFFLHIPFPSSDLFRTLPQREQILRGLLGADLVGFHTAAYLRHFVSSLLRVLGLSAEIDHVQHEGRGVRLGVFPMGVDATDWRALAERPDIAELSAQIRSSTDERILLGVDRLDYTKGIPRRLLSFERLLHEHPELHGKVRLIQIAVPSREDVAAYQQFRSLADELIGRIHGAFATPSWVPVHWIYRGLARDEIAALYRAADVMLVTPVRDGMNLVAKEFVATRSDDDGVLVLSELAGAAAELGEALHVNPFDIEGTAHAVHRAITMPREERRERMQSLRERVTDYDVHRWVETFLRELERPPGEREQKLRFTSRAALDELVARIRSARSRILLLDYDGTLVPFAPRPERAAPDARLYELLEALTELPDTAVHLVSGRQRETLERWFGDLRVGLHAEHGLWSRPPPPAEPVWTCRATGALEWIGPAERILQDFAARTPGAFVEKKSASLVWHYRAADAEYGALQANELRQHLAELLSNVPAEVVAGDNVVEVRPFSANKGRAVESVIADLPRDALIVAFGDDRTDEDLFAALPEDAIAVHVGPKPSRAQYRLASVEEARALLQRLAAPGSA
jgi:trehalose 6-phosphate synthase/phosphatase